MADATDFVVHLVTDEQMAAGRRYGRYAAVCGDTVLVGSLTAPDGARCTKCKRWRAGATR